MVARPKSPQHRNSCEKINTAPAANLRRSKVESCYGASPEARLRDSKVSKRLTHNYVWLNLDDRKVSQTLKPLLTGADIHLTLHNKLRIY